MTNNIVLVIIAHTDDEIIGMGGVIAKHVQNGDEVYCVSMTDGVGARSPKDFDEVKMRSLSSIIAGKIIGFTWLEGGNFPDNAMDTVSLLSVVQFIEGVKHLVKPTLIYTHSSADLNVDHRIVSEATLTAFRPQPNECWREIRAFEVTSATEYGHKSITNIFYPNLFIDIKDTWSKKIEALKAYGAEMRPSPHSRSLEGIENLAKLRGSQAGLYYAEAFEIIRRIER